MKTVALYLRVSSVDQHPETQLYDLRAMAQQRGFQIVAEYTDRISGTKARRPGLDDLLRDARRGRFQVLLVWASDRIARSVRHFLEVLTSSTISTSSSSASARTSIPAARSGEPS
jgi:DNA invertase Pin-like site-specific DNA recombinase